MAGEREGERERESEEWIEHGVASLFTTLWPDQPGQLRRIATMRRTRPVASRPLTHAWTRPSELMIAPDEAT